MSRLDPTLALAYPNHANFIVVGTNTLSCYHATEHFRKQLMPPRALSGYEVTGPTCSTTCSTYTCILQDKVSRIQHFQSRVSRCFSPLDHPSLLWKLYIVPSFYTQPNAYASIKLLLVRKLLTHKFVTQRMCTQMGQLANWVVGYF